MGRVISVATLFIICLLFIYTPYLRGLFFDQDFYLVEAIIFLLFLINACVFLIKSPGKEKLPYLVVFLLPLTHLLSLVNAESPAGALENLFRWLAYASLFVMVIWSKQIFDSDKLEGILSHVFQLTGIWVSIFAVFGVWGWVEFKDIMLGERLTGTFQYANTFAAVICSFWLYALVVLTKRNLPVWSILMYSLPLVAYGVGLLHSYSRGTLLLFPVAWFIGLLLLRGREQLLYFLYTLVSAAASLLVFRQIMAQPEPGVSNPGALAFLGGTLIVIGLVVLLRFLWHRCGQLTCFTEHKYVRYLVPGVVVLAGILLFLDVKHAGFVYRQMPASMQERLADISLETVSLLGRTNVYQDALAISKDALLLGVGGEGWEILYHQQQDLPYFNDEIHNGYLDILVSTGWLGLALFVLVIGFLLTQVIGRIRREHSGDAKTAIVATLPALAMLFFHGMIDFDFSYGTVLILVFWLLAIGAPAVVSWTNAKAADLLARTAAARVVLAASAVFVLVFAVYAVRFYLADRTAAQANGELQLEDVQPILEKAVSLNPYHTDYQLFLANVYATRYRNEGKEEWKTQALERIQQAERLEPRNSDVLSGVANSFFTLNEWEKGVQYLESARASEPFNVQLIDSIIRVESQLAAQFAELQEKEQAEALAKKAADLYESYAAEIEPFKSKEIPDKRLLDLENGTHFFIGQSYLVLGEYQQASEQLKKVQDQQMWLDAQALLVVAYEALGQTKQAAEITRSMVKQYSDFAQRVVTYRTLLMNE